MQHRSKLKIKVFLLEPHPLAARYLRDLLKREASFTVLCCSDSFPSPHMLFPNPQMEKSSSDRVLVIDSEALHSPITNVLTAIRSGHEIHILVLGRQLGDDDLCRLLFLGVQGFVPFDDVVPELASAIEAICQGRIWVKPDLLHRFTHFASAFSRNKASGFLAFTPREQAISGFLQQRLSNKEIASALGISERTVKFHVANVFAKAGVHDRKSVSDLLPHFRHADP